MWNMDRVLINMWDEVGFLFCIWDKYCATLPSNVIIQPLFIFKAKKICIIPVATYSLTTVFDYIPHLKWDFD